jgi:hypothetical protein
MPQALMIFTDASGSGNTAYFSSQDKKLYKHIFPLLNVLNFRQLYWLVRTFHIKTDNGPGYTSTAFKAFCSSYQILHTTGIPYNPQGQAIVEQAHQTLKLQLQSQEGGR